jgi:hypothetical protein
VLKYLFIVGFLPKDFVYCIFPLGNLIPHRFSTKTNCLRASLAFRSEFSLAFYESLVGGGQKKFVGGWSFGVALLADCPGIGDGRFF